VIAVHSKPFCLLFLAGDVAEAFLQGGNLA
jgi:hypothetical protein